MKLIYQNPSETANFEQMAKDPSRLPFYFTYNGKEYSGLKELKLCEHTKEVKEKSVDNVYTYALDTLIFTVKLTHYPQYGVSEYTVFIENVGSENSGIIENIYQKMEFKGDSPVLKGIYGDHVMLYRPYEIDLMKESASFVSNSGRPTHETFPYYNLEYGSGGVMLAIGWAGTFTAQFSYFSGVTTYLARSVNDLKTYLKPGEKIRTALFVIAPYKSREKGYASNFWRRWFVNCNLPPLDNKGTPVKSLKTCCIANDTGLPNSDGSISERYYTWKPTLEKMQEVGVHIDVRWVDAGWYIAPNLTSPETDWSGTVGTWVLDPNKWPDKTFLESTDYAREHGMRTLMWFEPERVTDIDNLAKNFGYNPSWAIRREGINSISNNIGNPDCYRWTVDRICKVLRENKVEIYREDNNRDSGPLWRYLDTLEGENRTGITECMFVDAHYRMWDEIIATTLSIGGCGFCDSCASGGGRNDLESLRRGIPLLRSDSDREGTARRLSMTWSFNQWIPVCGAITKEKKWQLDATGRSDVYTWRASYLPILNIDSQFVQDPDQDFALMRFGINEWERVKEYLLKDFYQLTPWHRDTECDGFTAFGYHDPETDKGVLLLFRMEECEEDTLTVTVPWAYGDNYRFTDEDMGETFENACGTVSFKLPEKRQARLIWVNKV